MDQNFTTGKSSTGRFAFQVFSLYLVFYVFFISDISLQLGLNFICVDLVSWINKLVIHKDFQQFVGTMDSYWAYLASCIFFILAILISLIWLGISKKKSFPVFYQFVYVIARYYVFVVVLGFGISKLDGLQFTTWPGSLLPSVGSDDTYNLFWTSLGSSKSYYIFGGLLETVAAILLLFRKTTTLGSLIAIPVLLNVLLIDIAYDVFLKLIVFHLIVFCIFLLIPDLNRLYKFFILKQNTSLYPSLPPLMNGKNKTWLQYMLKFLLVGYIVFGVVKVEREGYNKTYRSPYQHLIGIFNVKEFYQASLSGVHHNIDSLSWKKFAIDQFYDCYILLMNDSMATFHFKADIGNSTIEFTSGSDTTIKEKLHYVESKPAEWLFEGTYKTDSIRFSATKIDMYSLPLLKGRGKIKWTYD